jgi:magnesium chelatase subunit H
MASQGSGGAYEISQRMTALVGWGATAGFTEDWVYDGGAHCTQRSDPQGFPPKIRIESVRV